MNQSTITFVTSIIKIYDEPIQNKDIEWRLSKFRIIAETGIQICLYICPEYYKDVSEFIKEYPNIKIGKIVSLEDTFVSRVVNTSTMQSVTLPNNRNQEKDTKNYMILINSKVEFVNDAIQQNLWSSTHFAWIDFSIAYVFHDTKRSQEFLSTLSKRTFASSFLTLPGCWQNANSIMLDDINWRYCGGFLLGDKESIVHFYNLYQEHWPLFIEKYQKLVWEVNFWSYLEHIVPQWKPIWYKADHNDTILHLSADYCSKCLCSDPETIRQTYDYTIIPDYTPMNACYLYDPIKKVHILNTRYVNYSITETGRYIINDPKLNIKTKNMYSELDEETFMPKFYKEMQDPYDPINLPCSLDETWANGFEDIRLFLVNQLSTEQQVKFMATTVNYSPSQKLRIVVGNYDIDKLTYTECKLIHPPDKNRQCEKNWSCGGIDSSNSVIYTWSPQQIGRINNQTGELEIHSTYEITSPYFNRMRGSTQYTEHTYLNNIGESIDVLIGVVHFSEEYMPRHYFHILVMLEKTTLKLLKYTEIFYFDKIGIEFCVGFTIKDSKYYFWISKKDRDPELIIYPIDNIPFL